MERESVTVRCLAWAEAGCTSLRDSCRRSGLSQSRFAELSCSHLCCRLRRVGNQLFGQIAGFRFRFPAQCATSRYISSARVSIGPMSHPSLENLFSQGAGPRNLPLPELAHRSRQVGSRNNVNQRILVGRSPMCCDDASISRRRTTSPITNVAGLRHGRGALIGNGTESCRDNALPGPEAIWTRQLECRGTSGRHQVLRNVRALCTPIRTTSVSTLLKAHQSRRSSFRPRCAVTMASDEPGRVRDCDSGAQWR